MRALLMSSYSPGVYDGVVTAKIDEQKTDETMYNTQSINYDEVLAEYEVNTWLGVYLIYFVWILSTEQLVIEFVRKIANIFAFSLTYSYLCICLTMMTE